MATEDWLFEEPFGELVSVDQSDRSALERPLADHDWNSLQRGRRPEDARVVVQLDEAVDGAVDVVVAVGGGAGRLADLHE